MSSRIDRARRAVLPACAMALLAPGAVLAQDPRASAAQQAAREWLAAADRLDGRTTWNSAGRRLKQSSTLPLWSAALKQQRERWGAIEQRTVVATSFPSSMPGGAQGEFALVVFRASFAQRPLAAEEVLVEREADGGWRVIRYVIR